jgi:flagellar basal-body rod protein FlgB
MPVNLDQALGVHQHALSMRAERAKIISSNIANVDTPGYLAKDFDFKATLQNIDRQLGQVRGNDPLPSTDLSGSLKYRIPMQPSQDGNTAELGIEQAAFNQNAMDFQTSLTFLNSKISGLREAIVGR